MCVCVLRNKNIFSQIFLFSLLGRVLLGPPSTRQYYSTELRHDTIQEYDTRQNRREIDETVALMDAKSSPDNE